MGGRKFLAVRCGCEGVPGFTPGDKLYGVGRCPHCAIASPNLNGLWSDRWHSIGEDGWRLSLHRHARRIAVQMRFDRGGARMDAIALYPDAKEAHADIPEPARTFLQQAFQTLHAPDAAAVMAGSAVDAMLKKQGLADGSLYTRIDEALKLNLLTDGMAKWAHSVRLGSNRPRHADENRPHVSPDEAKQAVSLLRRWETSFSS